MALTKLICPECQSVLRPAKPVPSGKTVKCPECGNRFVAEETDGQPHKAKKPASPLTTAPLAAEAEPAGPRKPKRPADGKTAPKKPGAKKPSAADAPIGFADDEDGVGPTYSFVDPVENEDKPQIEYAPDMSIKDLRGPAHGALVAPSNAMIAVGGLGFLGWVALLVILLIPTLTPIDNDETDKSKQAKPIIGIEHGLGALTDEKDPGAELPSDSNRRAMFQLFGVNIAAFSMLAWYLFVLILLPIFVGMVYCAFVTYGAVRIQNLEGRGWGIASSIMMMLPLTSAGFVASTGILATFLLGGVFSIETGSVTGSVITMISLEHVVCIGVGVWGLITLLSERVIKGFEYKAE